MSIRVGIVGGAGFTGGELLRLLIAHPHATIAWATSRGRAGWPVSAVHPNLRGVLDLSFIDPEEIDRVDVVFLCLPHGETASSIERYAALAHRVIDLSSDFRLRDPDLYQRTYGQPHAAPEWLDRFVYGLPEVHREQLADARFISGVGCNATAMNLALLPLARSGVIDRVIADVKVGSSESGAEPSAASNHAERSNALRTFAPVSHRHGAEVEQACGSFPLHVTATTTDLVRGVLATCHVLTNRELSDREAWQIYRDAYADEPFVRIVRERRGLYRLPEPKILAGTNYADVGFVIEPGANRIVALGAIDNLGKGAAGSAVQSMNIACGFDEAAGLAFPGLHPA
ncbi:MAG: N-acetyl-gamma-glutamyl-phosphate reductase [Phycisphaerales bacterium]|jgi:N-acetyl-gamma-glutamyl-phosphate/LysW-gamma-L-alpha-aminoadipyl-6-phosphate reductase